MLVWINGAFGAGKSQTAFELKRRVPGSIVFDPENAGYYMRKNLPPALHKPDFRDHPEWRSINREMLSLLAREFGGPVWIPMTLTDPAYFDELIGALRREGADVRHFLLSASAETIKKRLKKRLDKPEGWAGLRAAPCAEAFAREPVFAEGAIDTEEKDLYAVCDEILSRLGIAAPPDDRGRFARWLRRLRVQAGQIR